MRHVLDVDKTSAHWIIHWSLYESENYDRFGMDDGSGWMQRLLPLRDELLRGDLRPLYLGWLAGVGALPGDEAEPEVPAGLSVLSPAQQALAEFLEIDPDMLAAAAAGSAPMPQTTEGDDGRLDVWLETWPREAMLDVLKLLAQGRGQEAESHVRGRHAAWLKAQRLPAEPGARRRRVAELNELAESLALVRQEHEAQERAKEAAERRREREEELQRLMAEVDQRWEAIDAQARRGTALGYEYVVRALTDLAEAYTLTSTPQEFERALRRFLVPHAKRGALLRRLTAAGLTAGGDDELARLRAENARLVELLEAEQLVGAPLSTDEKVALFRRLFRGRSDVYPVRWENKAGKSGYAPACANEWRAGVCGKPRVKCADCGQRLFVPLTDRTVYDHLAGRHVIGVYPLLADDSCHFLAVDFDAAEWRNDAQAFVRTCQDLDVPVALEISRSGNGAHAWIFFSSNVPARDARRLGTALISHTCARTRQLQLTSYDRLFPNQDSLPKGGFDNLIALPLQKASRAHGGSLFVDDALRPYADQWAVLASVAPMVPHDIEPVIQRATGGSNPLDVTFITEDDLLEPWKRPAPASQRLPGSMPAALMGKRLV